MPSLVRAIISGFGYKIGVELATYLSERVGLRRRKRGKVPATEEDLPEGLGNDDRNCDEPRSG